MRRECQERFPHHRLQMKPLVSDPGVTHLPWWMPGSQTRVSEENVPGLPGACATHNFTYLARGPWKTLDVFFDARSSKLMNMLSTGCCLEMPWRLCNVTLTSYSDVIMGAMVSQITSLTIVYSTVYSGADQRRHQSSASLAFVWGIYRWPVNSPQKWPVTRKMSPLYDVIMTDLNAYNSSSPATSMGVYYMYHCLKH